MRPSAYLSDLTDSVSRAIGAPVLGAKELNEALLVLFVGAPVPARVLAGCSAAIDGLVTRFARPVALSVTKAGVVLSILAMAVLGCQGIKRKARRRHRMARRRVQVRRIGDPGQR